MGTRISLDSIVYTFSEGCSTEAIREDFDGLTPTNVYGAISFYLDHQVEIDAYHSNSTAQVSHPESRKTPL